MVVREVLTKLSRWLQLDKKAKRVKKTFKKTGYVLKFVAITALLFCIGGTAVNAWKDGALAEIEKEEK